MAADAALYRQLGDALVLRGPLDRDSLRLAVLDLPKPAHRLAWLADHLDDADLRLLDATIFLAPPAGPGRAGGSGV